MTGFIRYGVVINSDLRCIDVGGHGGVWRGDILWEHYYDDVPPPPPRHDVQMYFALQIILFYD